MNKQHIGVIKIIFIESSIVTTRVGDEVKYGFDAGAVLLAPAVSFPLSYGAVTSTVTIENETLSVPDYTAGITTGDDQEDYIPELENLPDEGGHPLVGIQEPGGSSNVVPDGKVQEFTIIIPVSFCIKIKENHIFTSPTISINTDGYVYVTDIFPAAVSILKKRLITGWKSEDRQ